MTSDRAQALRGLYAVTPETPDTAWLLERVEECLGGGARLVQYRAKAIHPSRALEQARAIAQACRRHGAPLIVNDSVELALAAGAQGVHLGRDDDDVASARAAFPGAIIGASCYNEPARARSAARSGADYVAIGSMFASRSKPGATRAAPAQLAEAKRLSGLPVAAIGGITPDNAAGLVAAGADMLAVISAVFEADDVRAAARAFAQLFTTSQRHDVRDQPRAV